MSSDRWRSRTPRRGRRRPQPVPDEAPPSEATVILANGRLHNLVHVDFRQGDAPIHPAAVIGLKTFCLNSSGRTL